MNHIDILFGSETGTAQGLAVKTQNSLKELGYSAEVKDLENVSVKDLQSMQTALVFTSTWGDGEPPANATNFYEELKNTNESLSNLSYGVFAIGSTGFPQFCQTGIDMDTFLSDKGAKRLADVVTTEELSNSLEEWLGNLKKVL